MQFLKRSVHSGHVSKQHLDQEVTLAGWVQRQRDLGGVIFVDLRDCTGIVQLVFDPTTVPDVAEQARHLRSEFVIAVKGVVANRAGEAVNTKMATGQFEVNCNTLQILGKSNPLPFQLDLPIENLASEELRLKYRYLDLRRKPMHDIFKLRHEVVFAMRRYFYDLGFYEIETPSLTKNTPGGARNFLVPSRIKPETFYALSESPQLYKQLLMVGGFEKYFQIVRCFRDEALRANRQPEFTQLDIEMAFIVEEDIFKVCEGLFSHLLNKFLGFDLKLPLSRYSFQDVFKRFGSDKPDMRFEMEITDITMAIEPLGLNFLKAIFDKGGKVGCLQVKDHKFSRTELDRLNSYVTQELGAKGLLWFRWREDGTVDSPISKQLSQDFFKILKSLLPDLAKTDTVFAVAGDYDEAWEKLGQLRLSLGKQFDLIDKSKFNLFWVTDFPLFEWSNQNQRWESRHHAFTSPQEGWEDKEVKDIKARAYDLIFNGEEIGGGSIRINSAEVQNKIFKILGISQKEAKEKFSFLLEAQNFGYPPEGGIAFGLDRLIMILSGARSIRDVIAFPKTHHGSCLMMGSPSPADKQQLKELHLKSTYVKKEKT